MKSESGNSNDDLDARLNRAVEGYLANPSTFEIDLDELLELIDYANSNSSWSYSWLLVSLGQRLYPDDDLLKSRMSYLLYQEGEKRLSLKVLESCEANEPWAPSLKMLVTNEDNPQVMKIELQKVVADLRRIDNNTALNIVSAARLTGDPEMMKSIQADILSKCEQPTDFLLDLVDWAKEINDNEWRRQILDLLEQSAPFSPDFWEEMAIYHAEVERDYSAALSAVEYSLAIEPNSEPGMVVKARILFKCAMSSTNPDDANAYWNYLIEAMEKHPQSFDLVSILYEQLCSQWRFNNLFTDATPIARYVADNPSDKRGVDMLLHVAEYTGMWKLQNSVIRDYFLASENNSETDYFEWAQWCRAHGIANGSQAILREFYALSHRELPTAEIPAAYLEMLYIDGRYEPILDYANGLINAQSAFDPQSNKPLNTLEAYVILLAAARMRRQGIIEWVRLSLMGYENGLIESPEGNIALGSADRLFLRHVIVCTRMLGFPDLLGDDLTETIDELDIYHPTAQKIFKTKN